MQKDLYYALETCTLCNKDCTLILVCQHKIPKNKQRCCLHLNCHWLWFHCKVQPSNAPRYRSWRKERWWWWYCQFLWFNPRYNLWCIKMKNWGYFMHQIFEHPLIKGEKKKQRSWWFIKYKFQCIKIGIEDSLLDQIFEHP